MKRKTPAPTSGSAAARAPSLAGAEHHSAALQQFHARYDKGDRGALLDALYRCLAFDLRVPDWVRLHTQRAIIAFWKYEKLTLDEAFGVTRSQNRRTVRAMRRAVDKTGPITLDIIKATAAGRALDDGLFEDIGRRHQTNREVVKQAWAVGRRALGDRPKRSKRTR